MPRFIHWRKKPAKKVTGAATAASNVIIIMSDANLETRMCVSADRLAGRFIWPAERAVSGWMD